LTILASFLSSSVSYLGSPRARHSFPTRRSSDLAGDEVRGVRELHAAVADGAAPEFVQQVRFGPRLLTDRDVVPRQQPVVAVLVGDRKSTRLNSSHVSISYAVFCLKKKTKSIMEL